MIFPKKRYTVESVLNGHPDKICDQISDGLLDLYMSEDNNSHTAIECMGTGSTLIVAGEIASDASIDVEKNSKELYKEIVGDSNLKVINLLSKQSNQLASAIQEGGAGDQGVMYGYACNERNYNYLPYGYWIANLISKRLDTLREKTQIFLPDGKVQIMVSDNEIAEISVNVQHVLNADMQRLNYLIREKCLFDVKAKKMIINQDTGFVRGGIENDTGLTGRKMMVDTYGGLVPHGGGAFSGKDPSKVDRSAAYMCRYVAKNIVANGLAKECCVSVAYNFGEENPIMVNVETDRNDSNNISKIVSQNFDFRPQAIIERLNLKSIKYQPTATYGHFTNDAYPWEKIVELV